MNIRRMAMAATLLTGCVIPLVTPAASAAAAPVRSLCAPPADTVGPAVTQVKFGRSSINLNSGSRTQTIRVTASDKSGVGQPSGVARIAVEIQGRRFYGFARLKLTSGTRAAGTWTGRFVVSKYAHAGTYSINFVDVQDVAGNDQSYSGYGTTADGPNSLSLHPADNPTFAVTGTPAKRPVRKPAGSLSAFSLSPTSVNTTTSARYVHVTAKFKGPAPKRAYVFVNTVRKSQTRFVYLRAVLHDHNGTWTGSVRVPRWLGHQALQPTLSVEYSSKYRPAAKYYDAQRLQELGYPYKITVVSGVDKTKPKLKSLSFSPRVIDSTAGAVRVTVRARAADVGSGVRFIEVDGGIQHGINGAASGFYPFASAGVGYQSSNYFNVRLKKTSNGSWVGTTTVRRCVPSGTYKLNVDLNDVAGNYHYYSTNQLAKAGITSTVHVTSKHGDVAQPYVYSAATYGADSALFLNFSEGVAHVNTSTLTVYPLSPAKGRFTKPAAVTAVICANGTRKIDCSGSGGLVTSAVLTIPSLKPGYEYQVYSNLNQVSPQLTDGNRNPLGWNYAATQVKDA